MKKPKIVTATQAQLDEILALAKAASFPTECYALLEAILQSYAFVMLTLENAKTSIKRLKKFLFGSSTEKKRNVLPAVIGEETPAGDDHAKADANSPSPLPETEQPEVSTRKKRVGHGRNGAQKYGGATVIHVAHTTLLPSQHCPECLAGKIYRYIPKVIVRVMGQPPLAATIYRLDQLRCNLCGQIFTAQAPATMGTSKYDVSAAGMIAMLRYGGGMPFYRLGGLQACLKLPLPDATQWDIVVKACDGPRAIYSELTQQAAQGELLHNDDTPAKILDLMGKRAASEAAESRAVNTTGIVAMLGEHKIVLFFTRPRHAGENLREVLAHRAKTLPPPMQMCDGLSHNGSGEFTTLLGNCLAHGRRQFVDIVDNFPLACQHVIEVLGAVYQHDADCRAQKLSPQARLSHHQAKSGPLMASLKTWMTAQVEGREVEPNSGLGKAFAYMLRRWEPLTLFLRQAGAPLDNNVCERALKKAILHRKNSLFYKTQKGAIVGDIYMSLIYTCQSCDENPFDYLQALQTNVDAVKRQPHAWLPWNYRTMIVDTT